MDFTVVSSMVIMRDVIAIINILSLLGTSRICWNNFGIGRIRNNSRKMG